MQGQNQISIQNCCMIWSNIGLIPGEKKTSSAVTNWDINVCLVLYSSLLRWHLKIPQVFFSWSKGIRKCKYQPLYNQLQDPSFLKAHHRCCLCPLDYSPLPGKLFLITNYLLLLLPAVPSNISMCYLMQCQLGNAASFKAAALGIWCFKKKWGCLFMHYISNPTTTESSS